MHSSGVENEVFLFSLRTTNSLYIMEKFVNILSCFPVNLTVRREEFLRVSKRLNNILKLP